MASQSKEMVAENGASCNHTGGEQRVRGSEVFVGGLQRNVTEEVIAELFSMCGEVAEIRIMKDHSGSPKGYCFVRFTTKEAALKAQKEKNGTTLQGKKIGVTPSTDQDTLFLGNLRKEWGTVEVDQMVRQAFQDVQSVELAMPPRTGESPTNKKRQNRGFAFVHFASHAAAARAYRVASRPDFMLGGKWRPAIDWAENEPEPDPDEMAKVKTAFVGNLPNNVNEEFLQTLFEPFGKVERVAISRKSNIPVGFVHFSQRSELDVAIKELDARTVDGPDAGPKFKLQVSLAKPADKARKRGREENASSVLLAAAPPAKFAGALGAFSPVVSAGAYGEYTDYVVAKNPRVTNKQYPLPEVVDPYELAVLSLRPTVADKLTQIFRQGLASRQDVDFRALENLRDLPEHAAVSALDQFAVSSFADVRSKGAYLVGVINRLSNPHADDNVKQLPLSSITNIMPSTNKVRRDLREKGGVQDLAGRGSRPSGYGGHSHVAVRDSRVPGMGTAARTPVLEPPPTRYVDVEPKMLGYHVYGSVRHVSAHPQPFLHRMPSGLNDSYGLASHRSPVSAGPMAGAFIPQTMIGALDRRGFKFDPFTGEPFKFDPFTGEPLQAGPRIFGNFY